jgi:hypothetical protein
LIEKKHRIPQMAVAALLLGGPACGDSDGGGTPGGSTSGVNVSSSRIESIAKAICAQFSQCAPSEFKSQYSSVAECTESYTSEFEPTGDLSSEQKKCFDAYLDLYACITQLACDDVDNADPDGKCDDASDKVSELCPDDSYDPGYAGSSGKRARRMRIPKP